VRSKTFPKSLAVVAAVAVAAVTACGSSTGSSGSTPAPDSTLSKSPIVVGNVGVYSGTAFGAQYLQSLHGLQAWVKWTNDHGGINGHPVKLVSKDDANDPAKSLQAVKELVEQDHVVAILAPASPGSDNAWAKYVQQKKVPVLGGISLDENWTNNPYMLTVNDTSTQFEISNLEAAKTMGTKVGGFFCAELAACKMGSTKYGDMAKSLGIAWGGAALVAATATDYTAQCALMKQNGVDVLLPEIDGPTTVRIVKACATQGFTPAIVMPSADINADVLADPLFDGALGLQVSPLWFGDSALIKDWKQAYHAMYPNEVLNGYSTMGWQAGVVFATALKDAPDTVTSDTVLQALYAQPAGSTFGGWTSPLTFAPGKPTQTQPCMWYMQIKNGKLVDTKGNKYVCGQNPPGA